MKLSYKLQKQQQRTALLVFIKESTVSSRVNSVKTDATIHLSVDTRSKQQNSAEAITEVPKKRYFYPRNVSVNIQQSMQNMDMTNETLIVLCWELYEQGMPKTRIARRLGKHRETIHLWIKVIKGAGLIGFPDKYKQAKKGERKKRQVEPIVKRRVWEIREREYDCCGQKIQYFLKKEHGVHLSVPKIYEILAEKYVIGSKWKKNKQR
ncbi:transposase, partial [Chloroflexota bacterium]